MSYILITHHTTISHYHFLSKKNRLPLLKIPHSFYFETSIIPLFRYLLRSFSTATALEQASLGPAVQHGFARAAPRLWLAAGVPTALGPPRTGALPAALLRAQRHAHRTRRTQSRARALPPEAPSPPTPPPQLRAPLWPPPPPSLLPKPSPPPSSPPTVAIARMRALCQPRAPNPQTRSHVHARARHALELRCRYQPRGCARRRARPSPHLRPPALERRVRIAATPRPSRRSTDAAATQPETPTRPWHVARALTGAARAVRTAWDSDPPIRRCCNPPARRRELAAPARASREAPKSSPRRAQPVEGPDAAGSPAAWLARTEPRSRDGADAMGASTSRRPRLHLPCELGVALTRPLMPSPTS